MSFRICESCNVEMLWSLLRYKDGHYCSKCWEREEFVKERLRTVVSTYIEEHDETEMCVVCCVEGAGIRHHVSYVPVRIIKVCRSCHAKIHHTKKNDKYEIYKPKDLHNKT